MIRMLLFLASIISRTLLSKIRGFQGSPICSIQRSFLGGRYIHYFRSSLDLRGTSPLQYETGIVLLH